MIIIGCDCSSYSVGCTEIDENKINLFSVNGGSANDFDKRVSVIYNLLTGEFKNRIPDAVFIEGAIYLKNVKTTLMIARVVDMVIANCLNKKIYYHVVDNKSWKKDILGNGNATKEQIMEFSKKKWGDIFNNNQDLADSACIAFYGWRRLCKDG